MKMKTINLVWWGSLLLCLCATKAQSQNPSPIHVGLKGGTNFTKLSLSGTDLDSKLSTGYFVGGMARVDLMKFYIQGELLYAEKKSKLETSNMNAKETKWKSIEMPLLVGYKILDLSVVNVRVFGGGVYSYVMDDNVSILNNVQHSYRKFDKSNIGYLVGTGLDVGNFSVDLRYEGGLSNLSKDFKSKSNTFNVSVGYFFL